jgi:hypothetical protein
MRSFSTSKAGTSRYDLYSVSVTLLKPKQTSRDDDNVEMMAVIMMMIMIIMIFMTILMKIMVMAVVVWYIQICVYSFYIFNQ